MLLTKSRVQAAAWDCGFELAGIAPAIPAESEFSHYLDWVSRGLAGQMSYLTDRRAHVRADPRQLLPSARSIICLARLYNTPGNGCIARYARSEDYHDTLRHNMEALVLRLRRDLGEFDWRLCVDTAPLLERTYARLAGLGWIGKNTCLINQQLGSYIFLCEIITSLDAEVDAPAADRCGTCTRCIDACPTRAIVPGGLRTEIDATSCISYFTIELKGSIPEQHRPDIGTLVFGCDICQEVCPWNRKAPLACPGSEDPDLDALASLTPEDFRTLFRRTPVWRTKYQGLLRNVAIAMGNSRDLRYRPALQRLAQSDDPVVQLHAEWALSRT